MEYLIIALLLILQIEISRRFKHLSSIAADLQVRLFHIEKNLIETKEQVEALPTSKQYD